MLSRTLLLVAWFPTLVSAQLLTPVDRQLVAAGVWSEPRYNYAYWDAVRADWDSAFAAVVTETTGRGATTDVQFFRRLRRFVALLGDGQAELTPPPAIAARLARPPLALRSVERRPFIIDYAANDEMRIARPERLAEILAVQGIPAEQWIRDSVLPEVAGATEPCRWERAVARMLEGEKGTALHLLLRLPGGAQRGASVTRSVSLTAHWPLEPAAVPAGVSRRRRPRLERRMARRPLRHHPPAPGRGPLALRRPGRDPHVAPHRGGGRGPARRLPQRRPWPRYRRDVGREHRPDPAAAAAPRLATPGDRDARRVSRREGVRAFGRSPRATCRGEGGGRVGGARCGARAGAGVLEEPPAPLSVYFSSCARKNRITVRHALSATSGFSRARRKPCPTPG